MTAESIAGFHGETDEGRELFRRGEQWGEQRGVTETLARLLQKRFGTDRRIPTIARRLTEVTRDEAVQQAMTADSLTDLAEWTSEISPH